MLGVCGGRWENLWLFGVDWDIGNGNVDLIGDDIVLRLGEIGGDERWDVEREEGVDEWWADGAWNIAG